MMNDPRRHGPIGVDLGASRIVAVQFAAAGSRVVRAATSIGRRFDDLSADVQRLVRVMARQGFENAPVVVAPSDTDVTTLELRVPASSTSSATAVPVGEIVAAQLARLRKVDTTTVECAWWPTDGVATSTGVRSLAVGISTDLADSIALAFEDAGLDVIGIEPRPLAALRGLAPIGLRAFEVLLDVTDRAAQIVTLERGVVGYVRRLEITPTSIREGSVAARDQLLSEMRLTLGYLQRRDERHPVDRLLMNSGLAAAAFADSITSALEMPVCVADAERITSGGVPIPAEALVAVGLASRPEAAA